ncbi:hypothetical protein ATKI12_8894 [Kitasatospora sp. Ki12]
MTALGATGFRPPRPGLRDLALQAVADPFTFERQEPGRPGSGAR